MRKRDLLLLCFAIGLIACGSDPQRGTDADGGVRPDAGTPGDGGSADGSEVGYPEPNTRWPEGEVALPACTPYEEGFVEPVIAPAVGDLQLQLSSTMQPVGVEERIVVEVMQAGTQTLDADFGGSFSQVSASNNAQVISSSAIVAGRAEIVVRADAAGDVAINAALADGRTGSASFRAYQSQLPIWELSLLPSDFDFLVDNPDDRNYVGAEIAVDGVTRNTLIRIHGGSSRDYPKKSFRMDLATGQALDNGKDHIILRAEWNDKTMLRNYLAHETFRNGTWLPSSETEIVHFRVNGRYYGVMWHVDRVDADLLADNNLYRDGVLLKPEPTSEFRQLEMMEPLPNDAAYEAVYAIKKGEHHGTHPAAIKSLIEDIIPLASNDAFVEAVEQVVDVESVLVWLATNAIIQNADHVKKNFYMYRNPLGDSRWSIIPWDHELTFGHHYTDEEGVLDEQIFVDSDIFEGNCPGYCNRLWTRLWQVESYRQMYLAQIQHILENTFDEDFIQARIDNVICRATPDILADPNKRASNDEYLSRVDEIMTFMVGRRAHLAP